MILIINLLIFNDIKFIEKLINLGVYQPGADEIIVSWISFLLVLVSVVFSILAWIKDYWTLFERLLITTVTLALIYLIISLYQIGLLTL